MRCALCHDALDPEAPAVIYARNPQTNRQAWLHWWCYQAAFETLAEEPAKHPDRYLNRQDEYLSHDLTD